jgi:hypothetical protein
MLKKEETEPSIMIFKDDDGWWKIVSEFGTSSRKYETYEAAVHSLPKYLQEGLL